MVDLAFQKQQYIKNISGRNYESIQGNLQLILQSLPLPQDIKIITVGGTNGKGSTISVIEQALIDFGLSVVVNTSPHIKHYNERIRINGKVISDETLVKGFAFIEKIESENLVPLSFPDYSFLLACYAAMINPQLDILILEVGLGGEKDPANVLNADISVITNIDLDHTEILGNSREEILEKKIAIARRNKALVVGDPNPPINLQSLVNHYECKLYLFGEDFNALDVKYETKSNLHINNIATAQKVIFLLSRMMNKDIVLTRNSLEKIDLQARGQLLLRGNHFFLLDVAHNRQAIKNLYYQILDIRKTYNIKKVTAIFTALSSKLNIDLLSSIVSIIDEWNVFSINEIDYRGATQFALKKYFQDLSSNIFFYNILDKEFKKIILDSQPRELIVVFGSFVLVGEFLKVYEE